VGWLTWPIVLVVIQQMLFPAPAGSILAGNPYLSINVFAASVVGGLGSLLGAFVGALFWNGTFFWLQGAWRLFASGISVLLILLVAPGGLASLWYDLRDLVLRKLGRRAGDRRGGLRRGSAARRR
jgi:ABC-type branched-subunit amino acid transport system permease subunit